MTEKQGRYKRPENRSSENFTALPSKYPQGYFKPKPCRECSEIFQPLAPSHLYCSDACSQRGHDRFRMKKAYGIELEEYEELVKAHNGFCAICGGVGFELVPGQRLLLVIDHCHNTGKVRGLLCHNCNRGLGLFKDNKESLKNAIKYLGGSFEEDHELEGGDSS